jgi:hypothetical protein
MVDWKYWDWRKLFKQPDDLPAYLAMGLENMELEEKLCFYELVQPDKRLLDFWCGHLQTTNNANKEMVDDWTGQNPDNVMVHLHPCLKTEAFHEAISELDAIAPLNLKQFFPFLGEDTWIERTLISVICAPLMEAPRSVEFLLERFLAVRPLEPVSLSPSNIDGMLELLKLTISEQEELGVFLLEVIG